MLNQAFTAENFLKIFEQENRKGNDLAGRFFPTLADKTNAIRAQRKLIRNLRGRKAALDSTTFERELAELKEAWARAKREKFQALEEEIEKVSSNVLDSSFRIKINSQNGPQGKAIYIIEQTPEAFFVLKQLQQNINRLYGVKQANRHESVCRVRDTVASKYPFEVIRTDISSFYESIDRALLIRELDQDQLLSASSKRIIRQILRTYGQESGQPHGIPRGIGVSAYLAELYMRPIDREIRSLPGQVLYTRYVDDIIAIFARPPSGAVPPNYLDLITDILSRYSLTKNASKTESINLGAFGVKTFEYLGYRFSLNAGRCDIAISDAKLAKYKQRVLASFDEYRRAVPTKPKKAHRDLVARIKFLTGNTRLANSKSGVVTGVYFNNSVATDLTRLQELDRILNREVRGLKGKALKYKLKKFKFEAGFTNRRFHCFSPERLSEITSIWKYV